MQGATEFAKMFKSGQHGRLYLCSSSHARGETFRIFVLPSGEAARPNGPSNGPLNSDAVEVYGVVSGNPGWTETYGWLHRGKWEADFAELVASRRREIAMSKSLQDQKKYDAYNAERHRNASLLAAY